MADFTALEIDLLKVLAELVEAADDPVYGITIRPHTNRVISNAQEAITSALIDKENGKL